MKTNMKYILIALLLMAFVPTVAQQSESKSSATEKGWFVGVQGGMPFGVSTFSSFGADKTRFGWSAGLYGGYRFNPVLSLEASAKFGQIRLSAQDCCIDHNQWLGVDGMTYNAPVLNMDGWDYGNLKSRVFMQHYGLQLNVNILGFFKATKQSRWTLEVSPLIAAVGTKASVKAISGNAEVLNGDTHWHLGVGGNLQVAYRITKHFNVGVYSGITYLTDSRMDGMSEYLHKANYIWESGIKLGFSLPTSRHAPAPVVEPQPTHPAPVVTPEAATPVEEVKVEPVVVSTSEPVAASVVMPHIYFAFNSVRIADSELHKLEQIRQILVDSPQMSITLFGWCDRHGSKSVNDRISLNRAISVQQWLVSKGIDANRIAVKGCGSDFNQASSAKARRVECNENE